MKFVKSKHRSTLTNGHLGEFIKQNFNKVLSKCSETSKSNKHLRLINNAFVVFQLL